MSLVATMCSTVDRLVRTWEAVLKAHFEKRQKRHAPAEVRPNANVVHSQPSLSHADAIGQRLAGGTVTIRLPKKRFGSSSAVEGLEKRDNMFGNRFPAHRSLRIGSRGQRHFASTIAVLGKVKDLFC